MGAAISENAVLMHAPIIGPTEQTLSAGFSYPEQKRGQTGDDLVKYVIVQDKVIFHHSNTILAMVCNPQQVADGVPPTLFPIP